MAHRTARRRLKVLVDDGAGLEVAWALRLQGKRLLVDAGIELPLGAEVTLYPLPDDPTVDLLHLAARVVGRCEDVLAPADAPWRFLAVLELWARPEDQAALERCVEQGVPVRTRRRALPTHDADILEAAFRPRGAAP